MKTETGNTEKAPLGLKWGHWYIGVLVFLVLQIFLSGIFTRVFS